MLFQFEQEQGGEGGEQEIPCEELMRSWRPNRHNREGGREGGRLLEVEEGKHCPDIWPSGCDLVHCLRGQRVDTPEHLPRVSIYTQQYFKRYFAASSFKPNKQQCSAQSTPKPLIK